MFSRREFLQTTALAGISGLLVLRPTRLYANPLGLPIGSQTYPHRQMIVDANFTGLLDALRGIGVEQIELCSPFGYREFASLSDGKKTKRVIEDHGLKCISS